METGTGESIEDRSITGRAVIVLPVLPGPGMVVHPGRQQTLVQGRSRSRTAGISSGLAKSCAAISPAVMVGNRRCKQGGGQRCCVSASGFCRDKVQSFNQRSRQGAAPTLLLCPRRAPYYSGASVVRICEIPANKEL